MAINIQKIQEAGISQRVIDYIFNVIDPKQKKAVLEDPAFEDTIKAISATDSIPTNAIEITTDDSNAIAQIENGQGKTFVLRSNLNFVKTLNIPSNVTIYVDGTITKNGSHVANFYDDENKGNSVDAVFRVDDKSNVKLIGVNNAKLVSNQRATGVYIEGSSNVEVRGFDIGNVWEGVVAHWGNKDVKIFNNYIHDTGKRAIWSLGSEITQAAHNFIENAGGDGFDFDAYATGNVAYENVVIGWRRWAGFVEEGAQDSYFARNLAIMAEFDYKHPDPNNVPDTTYTMGWADNGTTAGISRLTSNNYFIGNTLFRPSSYTRKNSGGGYFAKRNQQGKGQTYFWGNKGNVGFALDGNGNKLDSQQNPQDTWYKANFEPTVAPGQSTLDKFEALFPNPIPQPQPNPTPVDGLNGIIKNFDQITFHFDGNNNDPDDLAAIPIAAALTKAAGLEGKTTFFYGNNISEPSFSNREKALSKSGAFAEKLGIDAYSYQEDGIKQTTNNLVKILDSGQKILAIEGGPMEAIYRALERTSPENRKNITLISHSTWNEDRNVGTSPGGGKPRTWSDIKRDFPEVKTLDIQNQNSYRNNDGFFSSDWKWLDQTNNPVLKEARSLMRDAGISNNKLNDPSDAGMLFYALTGNEGGNPFDAQRFFNDNPPSFGAVPNPNPTPNNSIMIEAETMQLGGEYRVETIGAASGNQVISLRGGAIKGTGTAEFNFNGASGKYDIKVTYFDENDGIGRFNLNQSNQQIASVSLNQQLGSPLANSKTLTSTTINGISVKTGESFTLTGFEDGTATTAEHIRIDKVEFMPVASEAIRINAGGSAFTDSNDNQWSKDNYFQGGNTYSTTAGIDKTQDDTLFQTERFAKDLSYAIPVENGNYQVNLNFAEIYWNQDNQRVFDVKAENQIVLDNFDIHKGIGGKNVAVEKSFNVNVTDGVLNLDLNASIDNAKLSGIEIIKDSSTPVANNPNPLPKPIDGSGWYKAFEDNFDDNKFDTSTWYNRTDKAYKTSAIEESNSKLKLHNKYSENGGSTGAWIQSREEFKFGYYEAEVHFDGKANGNIWPTWWVWGGNSERDSQGDRILTTEFDLFEYSGFAAKYFDNKPTTSHHYRGKKDLFPENKSATVSDKSSNFRDGTQPHKWGMLWTPWEVSFFYDGQKYMTSKHPEDAAEPKEKLRLIFSTSPHLSVGPEGEPANPTGNPTPGEALPSFIIDNVQVWQKDSYFDLIGNAIRINAGGNGFTDNQGNVWDADKYFKNGQNYQISSDIGKTNDDALVQSHRYQKNLSYGIPLEAGNYQVNLKFTENYFDAASKRIFDVSAEDALKIDNLDVYAEAGGKNMILDKSFQVNVQDGFLNLNLNASTDNAMISGIEILPAQI